VALSSSKVISLNKSAEVFALAVAHGSVLRAIAKKPRRTFTDQGLWCHERS